MVVRATIQVVDARQWVKSSLAYRSPDKVRPRKHREAWNRLTRQIEGPSPIPSRGCIGHSVPAAFNAWQHRKMVRFFSHSAKDTHILASPIWNPGCPVSRALTLLSFGRLRSRPTASTSAVIDGSVDPLHIRIIRGSQKDRGRASTSRVFTVASARTS
jgi:hypothetical protein